MEYNPYTSSVNNNNLYMGQVNALNAQVANLQNIVRQYESMGQSFVSNDAPQDPQTPRYPVNRNNPQTVEDIIAVPEYKAELFKEYEQTPEYKMGEDKKFEAAQFADALFLEFAEKRTRYPSTILNDLRASVQTEESSVNQSGIPVNPKPTGRNNKGQFVKADENDA